MEEMGGPSSDMTIDGFDDSSSSATLIVGTTGTVWLTLMVGTAVVAGEEAASVAGRGDCCLKLC